MSLAKIIKQVEGRKLEFKEILPTKSDLVKTIVAFANDAGGELYIGIKDKPREVIGLEENELIALEEKISNTIHDKCFPTILPEITFLRYKEKHIIKILIHKGINPPFHLKSKGIQEGTFIRVGSASRQANSEIINELEGQKKNISFDSELTHLKPLGELKIDSLRDLYKKTTGDELTKHALNKLALYISNHGKELATNALVLLSDDRLKKELFPYAKIECASFKGTIPGNFIDQKTIDGQVGLQADLAYQFVLRHISEGSIGYEGVYRKDRWEYPVMAIREIIRNAIIHRNYSLRGKDIKIAIFDDKVEITSPGKLPPSVDYEDMESGQSDIRNKILAPLFKRMGIIEQWGNGLQLISDQLAKYPEIELRWKEPGLAFRVSFVKKNYKKQELKTVEETVEETVSKILNAIKNKPKITAKQLQETTGLSRRGVEYNLDKLKKEGRIERIGSTKAGFWKFID